MGAAIVMQTALRGFVSSIITPFRAVSRTIAACVVSALPDDPVPAQQAQNFERRGQVWILKRPEGVHLMDIVFFHGLQLSAGENAYYSTWVNGSGVCWPIEWLQQDFPGARIMSVKYDAQAIGHPGQQGLRDLAQSILTDLHHANIGKQHNTLRDVPLVLVGHSLGGVVLKQVCLEADRNRERHEDNARILRTISTIAFFSTPHAGSHVASLGGLAMQASPLLCRLMPFDRDVAANNCNFRRLCNVFCNWNVFQVHETKEVQGIMVVSAASGLAALEDVRKFHPMADTDHFTIAKPNSRQDSVYLTFTREVKKLIYQWVDVSHNQWPEFLRYPHGGDSGAGGNVYVARHHDIGPNYTPGTAGKHFKGMTYEGGNAGHEASTYQVLHTPQFELFFEWRNMAEIPEAVSWSQSAKTWDRPGRRWLPDAFNATDTDQGAYIVRGRRADMHHVLVVDWCFGKIYECFSNVGAFALRSGPCRCCSQLEHWGANWEELQVLCWRAGVRPVDLH